MTLLDDATGAPTVGEPSPARLPGLASRARTSVTAQVTTLALYGHRSEQDYVRKMLIGFLADLSSRARPALIVSEQDRTVYIMHRGRGARGHEMSVGGPRQA